MCYFNINLRFQDHDCEFYVIGDEGNKIEDQGNVIPDIYCGCNDCTNELWVLDEYLILPSKFRLDTNFADLRK